MYGKTSARWRVYYSLLMLLSTHLKRGWTEGRCSSLGVQFGADVGDSSAHTLGDRHSRANGRTGGGKSAWWRRNEQRTQKEASNTTTKRNGYPADGRRSSGADQSAAAAAAAAADSGRPRRRSGNAACRPVVPPAHGCLLRVGPPSVLRWRLSYFKIINYSTSFRERGRIIGDGISGKYRPEFYRTTRSIWSMWRCACERPRSELLNVYL